MFCDLVDSSRLSTQLDPEDLRELILWYQRTCTAAIQRFGGTVSRYIGDGIMALFGYPQAHEDDAERAVSAGLEIVEALAALTATQGRDPLAVRVGIATGLVVVGDTIGEGAAEEQAVVGETPNLAARVQSIARPNAVVVAERTHALLGERFECADLGTHELKGFAEPVRIWRPIGRRTRSSAGGRSRTEPPPLVNRELPARWLIGLWREAEQVRGKVALLCGDAGIGKSRIVRALRDTLAKAPYTVLRYQCSPYYVNTALHPVIDHIERAAAIAREDSAEVKLERLASWLGGGAHGREALPFMGALLSIPTAEEHFAIGAMSAQRQKERTFELLFGLIERMAAAAPLLIIVEDVHWMDPTTHELLTQFIERVPWMRALVVITYRPDFSPDWLGQPHVEQRLIERLAPEHAFELVRRVAAERLPSQTVEQVVARTDGVPLFIEELTKVMAEAHHPGDVEKGGRPAGELTEIPATLQDSLMARLDQLGPAKGTAQIAGAIGREFDYELLQAVASAPAEQLRESLRILEQSGLIERESLPEGQKYAFKHALVQEAAYHSLLRSRRRQLHQSIAEVLEARFPQTARDAPELVAHHWTEAGDVNRAVAAWLTAGRRASQRSEYREAIGHLRRGLDLVSRLDSDSLRRERERDLLLALAPALITTEGAGTRDVTMCYSRALELCDASEPSAHFAAQWGWWRICMDHRAGRERADKLIEVAQQVADPGLKLQAHHCQWATLYMLGAHRECCHHAEAGLTLYEPERDRPHATLYGGHDARVCALGESALSRWMLGEPDAALELAQAAVAWSNEISHVGSRAHAMDYALVLRKFRRDTAAVYEQARELQTFASEQRLHVHRAKGAFFRGWARALLHDVHEGLDEMLEGIASERAADTPHDFTLYYEMLAETYQRAGRHAEGLRAIDDGFDISERHGLVFWNAELHRRRGELLIACEQLTAAEASLGEALACARSQDARALELRAAVSLTRLHAMQGRRETAAEILRPLFETFSEGLDTADFVEARQLLDTRA
jgi:class 3 adenylate cyclase/predicted ATPase